MDKKVLIVVAILIVIAIIGVVAYFVTKPKDTLSDETPVTSETATPVISETAMAAEVATVETLPPPEATPAISAPPAVSMAVPPPPPALVAVSLPAAAATPVPVVLPPVITPPAIAAPTVESQGYKYVNGINVPLRLNTTGDIECLSTPDGRNCMWKNNEEETRSLLASPMPANYSPLSCGEMHKNLYGNSGYDNPTHWCYNGMKSLNPTSPKIAPPPAIAAPPVSLPPPAPAIFGVPVRAGQPSPDNAISLAQAQYTFFKDNDIPGNDIRCINNPTDFESCRVECNRDPNCKAYNHVYDNGVWGAGKWGCCLKTPNTPPTTPTPKIDYFLKNAPAAVQIRPELVAAGLNASVGGRVTSYARLDNFDPAGNDIECIRQVGPDACKAKCDTDNNCVGYNEVKANGIWGKDFGCCLKKSYGNIAPINGINFFFKMLETFGMTTRAFPMRYIRLGRRTPGVVNIAEIEAYDSNNNLIPFTQAVYGPSGNDANGLSGFGPTNATDRNFKNFAHTNGNMASFLQVGFNSEVNVSKIVITNRQDCCQDRMRGTYISFLRGDGATEATPTIPIDAISKVYSFEFNPRVEPSTTATLVGGGTVTATASGGSVQVTSPVRYIRLGRRTRGIINIAEIQAYDINNNLIPSTAIYGPRGRDADGLAGFEPVNANDGNLNNLAHTLRDNSFIQLNLGSNTPIAKLVITNRKDGFKERMIGTVVEFFNESGAAAAPSINIDDIKDTYTFQFRSTGVSSSWLASRINTPQYLRHLQNKNYLLY